MTKRGRDRAAARGVDPLRVVDEEDGSIELIEQPCEARGDMCRVGLHRLVAGDPLHRLGRPVEWRLARPCCAGEAAEHRAQGVERHLGVERRADRGEHSIAVLARGLEQGGLADAGHAADEHRHPPVDGIAERRQLIVALDERSAEGAWTEQHAISIPGVRCPA